MPSDTATHILGATTIFLIVLGLLIGIAIILIGMRFKRQRVAGEKELIERREAAHIDEVAPSEPDDAPPAAPAPRVDETPVVAAPPAVPEPVEAAPVRAATPAPTTSTASDITQLKGLGPKLAATLAEQGYTRLDQVAALTPDQAAELDAKLGSFQGRMARDRWIEQAKLLVAGDRAGYEAAFGKLG